MNHKDLIRMHLFSNGIYDSRRLKGKKHLFTWLDGYDGLTTSEKVWNALYKRPICRCGNQTSYVNFTIGYRPVCSIRCAQVGLADSKSYRHSALWNDPEWKEQTSQKMKQSHFDARAQKKLNELKEKDIVPLDELEPGFDNEYRWRHSCGEVFVKPFKRTYSIYCPKCHVSKGQGELYEAVRRSYSGQIIVNDRAAIAPLEIDIYLPDLKIGFEFNGKYWHTSGGVREAEKTFEAEEAGIKIMHIWEVEWNKHRLKQTKIVHDFISAATKS